MCICVSFAAAITNPKAEPNTKDAQKSFNFDYSYWSHEVSPILLILPIQIHLYSVYYSRKVTRTSPPKS